jgi:hypothetical protein
MGSKPPIRVRARSARTLTLGAAGTSVLAVAVAVAGPSWTACTTHQCDTLFITWNKGEMVGPDTYETSALNADWIDYPGLETVHVEFPPVNGRAPVAIAAYVGNGVSPNGGPDYQPGDEWSAASGLLAIYGGTDSSGFYVTNGSCAQYYARFVVTFAPEAVTLFGGVGPGSDGGTATFDDTWTWANGGWTAQAFAPDAGAPARALATFVSLPTATFLFGGTVGPLDDNDTSYLLDTRTWDGVAWSPIGFPDFPTSYPSGRADAASAALNGRLVMFGGHGVDGSGAVADLGDTWTWDGKVGDAWVKPSNGAGGSSPPPRSGASAATLNGNVVLFGGCSDQTAAGCASGAVLGDTWLWNGSSWTQLSVSGPSPRFHAAATSVGSAVLLFGGDSGSGDLGDTWLWDGTTWTPLAIPGPSARSEAAMATLDGTAVLFGGSSDDGAPLADTWTWTTGTWTQQNVAGPSPRAGAAAAGP